MHPSASNSQRQQPHLQQSSQPSRQSHSQHSGYPQQQSQAAYPQSARQHPQEAPAYYAHAPTPTGAYPGTQANEMLRPLPFANYAQHGASLTGNTHGGYFAPSEGAHGETTTTGYPQPFYPSHSNSSHHPNSSQIQASTHSIHPPVQSSQFIPTPSQTYQETSSTTTRRARTGTEPYPPPAHLHHPQAGHPGPTSYHSQANTGRPVHSPSSSAGSAAGGERFPCSQCDRTFTRLHDKKRHFDTIHAANPPTHRCRHCAREFSRTDSLKRHIDNGCDVMPSITESR
ncbi:hypothetical protein SERLA73DRAFT_180879 [Serpula lacrymans var. lacrymans S7.3]|uniref:C2H2-type domain-containing protein n=1 Tax=Serpula lacrymans var. lacrymans (strain S7.3) TaxID=936435 RepID=F8PWL1_SERL3|nr:hypothetical protein SERLA73DRAFT_180879 [Serpula lacrymans var. lacrymans S7.3]